MKAWSDGPEADDEPEWDSIDSNAYQQAIESGLIPDPDADPEVDPW